MVPPISGNLHVYIVQLRSSSEIIVLCFFVRSPTSDEKKPPEIRTVAIGWWESPSYMEVSSNGKSPTGWMVYTGKSNLQIDDFWGHPEKLANHLSELILSYFFMGKFMEMVESSAMFDYHLDPFRVFAADTLVIRQSPESSYGSPRFFPGFSGFPMVFPTYETG